MAAKRFPVPASAVFFILGIGTLSVVMGLEAGILPYLAPIEFVGIAGLLAYAVRRKRIIDARVKSSGKFQAMAMGRPPEPATVPISPPSVGLANGPSGKLGADTLGIRWRPNFPRTSRVPAFDVEWTDVDRVEIERVHRLGDPAFVHVYMRSGVRRSVLTGNATSFQSTVEKYSPGLIRTID